MKNHASNSLKKKFIILVVLFILLMVAFIIYLIPFQHNAGNVIDPTSNHSDISSSPATTEDKVLSLSELIASAKSIKNELVQVLHNIKQNDLQSAKKHSESILKNIQALQVTIDRMASVLNGPIPLFQKEMNSIQGVLSAADMAVEDILMPAIDLLELHPLSELRVDDGLNVMVLGYYLDFAESIMPNIEVLMGYANSIDLSLIDTDGEIAKYLETANKLMDLYHENPSIFSLTKSMLGAEEDRLYLLVAQNSSEIRASGGFPGSIGTIRIQNGVLTLGDFQSVYNVFYHTTPSNITITTEEYRLFNYLSGIKTPWDADLCPDFERVAQIWASAYETRNKESVSGVISMTPHIVQKLLAVIGEEIVLSDGLVLTAENATKVLQHDLYFKYFSKNYVAGRESISDQLFAEAAKKAMDKLMDNISASHIPEYLSVMSDSSQNRTMLLWMRNEEEQEFITNLDWNGGLNSDPLKPEAGIYYNCISASKMGWFLLIDSQIGDPTLNKDGSNTYPITVTFSNNMTQEELKSASGYITGGSKGVVYGVAYFFAPAGGTVENFHASNKHTITLETYQGLKLGFMREFLIYPNESVTVTYTVTTAPGVDTPLVISQTPTAQQS